jgi:3-oxoacyl-[acyl-carrier protein] reductase
MAKEGANVVICDIKEDALHGVGKEIEALGKQSFAVRCDVSSSESTSSDRSSVQTAAS